MRTLTDIRRRRRYRDRPKRGNRGSAVIEMALLAPWFLFLFIGVVDMGFYCYDLIAVENATRVAAEYTATGTDKAGDQGGACTRVLQELTSVPNIAPLVSSSTCTSLPLIVTATSGTGLGSLGTATTVTVTYQTTQLIPIPSLFPGRFTFLRSVVARVKS